MVALVAIGCLRTDGGPSNLNSYISESEFESNLEVRIKNTGEIIDALREAGVTDESLLRLEFFFYTNLESNAVELESTLKKRGYRLEKLIGGEIGVRGWTTPIRMDETTVVQWVEDMCRTRFAHDCEFDGWGTNPNQPK
jgi:regulator of RNase E activity RraB